MPTVFFKSLALVLLFAACTSVQNPRIDTERVPSQTPQSWATLIPNSARALAPNAMALKSWKPVTGYATGFSDPSALKIKAFNCPDPNLYPTQPYQALKQYSVFEVATYDHVKLRGDDEACATSARQRNGKGVLFCLRPDLGYYVIYSDTYMDRCGQFYRGFKDTFFLKKNETMGTLVSPGHTVYPKAKSQFKGEFIVGGTYAVKASEFSFLTAITPEELRDIEKFRAQALKAKTHRWNTQSYLWELIGDL